MFRADARGWKAWRVDDYAEAISPLLMPGALRPALLFVHGRGDEPQKSVPTDKPFHFGNAISHIQDGHGVDVLMLNWQSKAAEGHPFDRCAPLKGAAEAVPALAAALQAQAALSREHPKWQRPALLVHSMGAIVLQQLIESGQWPSTPAPLFSNVVISEPDADESGHAVWLSRLARTESVWVTLNAHDPVLTFAGSGRKPGERSLGLGRSKTEPRAEQARYVDLSFMSPTASAVLAHPVYVPDSFPRQCHVDRFIGRLLRGEAIDATRPDPDIASVDGSGTIRLRRIDQMADGGFTPQPTDCGLAQGQAGQRAKPLSQASAP